MRKIKARDVVLSPLLRVSTKGQVILTHHGRFQHVLECRYVDLPHPKHHAHCRVLTAAARLCMVGYGHVQTSHRGGLVVRCHIISKAEAAMEYA